MSPGAASTREWEWECPGQPVGIFIPSSPVPGTDPNFGAGARGIISDRQSDKARIRRDTEEKLPSIIHREQIPFGSELCPRHEYFKDSPYRMVLPGISVSRGLGAGLSQVWAIPELPLEVPVPLGFPWESKGESVLVRL